MLRGVLVLVLSGCSHGSAPTPVPVQADNPSLRIAPRDPVSIEAKMAAVQEGSSYVTEIQFVKGSSAVNSLSKKNISEVLFKVKSKNDLKQVELLIWGDTDEKPSVTNKHSEENIQIAKARGQSLKLFLKTLDPKLHVKTVNMAEDPGWLLSFLKTSDVRVRQAFEVAGKGSPKTAHSVLIFSVKR